MVASGLLKNGPQLEWSRDNKQYEHFQTWQKWCKMVFKAEGIQLVDKWENSGKLVYENPPGAAEGMIPSVYNLNTN